ncbi:hypothetical protein U27_05097 [Candidatus Vecturithrix granuli]|uniref:ABC transporter substrate-binding protein n=1 Tax=Vecturithrix granuli TaxID=1499967 RepID=A0A081C0L9_VECG1|nr:hypothetical protein U27_05097 [Candidatus Vecturithrix granuli]
MRWLMRIMIAMICCLGFLANAGFTAEMKTVVLVEYTSEPAKTTMKQHVLAGLAQAGFQENTNLKLVSFEAPRPADWPEQVAQLAPDVVIEYSGETGVTAKLHELGVPTVSYWGTAPYVGPDGIPTANITGVYTGHKDTVYNSLKLLHTIAPLKPGQQAVFFENKQRVIFPKEEVLDALKRLDVPLKAIEDTTHYEDWQAALLKYNEDPEVGWLVVLAWPYLKRDGTIPDRNVEVAQWQRERLKKPYVTFWVPTVQSGVLCAFAVDTDDVALQLAEMAARILKGEPIQSIKAEYPRKTLVAINRKTADFMGITLSLDALKLANVIFNDYEGKDVIRK